jgi:hypothetical protein
MPPVENKISAGIQGESKSIYLAKPYNSKIPGGRYEATVSMD